MRIAEQARAASRLLRTATNAQRSRAIWLLAEKLRARRGEILAANAEDLKTDLPGPKKDRLRLDVDAVADALEKIAALPDPLAAVEERTAPGGFRLAKRRVALGVILMIFESRPNVTPEAGALCLKAGNAALLRGGSEARRTNASMIPAIREALQAAGLPPDAIQIVEGGHDDVARLLKLDALIDLVIPRGGEDLIRAVARESAIPVLKHYRGNCHVYVDAEADLDMAERILRNSKCQRPATCNAAEKAIVHEKVARAFIPRLASLGVELRGDEAARAILPMKPATEEDWSAEYLDLVLGVRIVKSLDEAIEHIERYGSHHTDAIVTRNEASAKRFLEEVDSASVMWNASTRLADGGEFGLGAEAGISTDKLHARGPMGVDDLTTYKWVVFGDGNLRK